MRTIEEIEQEQALCTSSGTQQETDKLWLEWFRAVTHGVGDYRLKEICNAECDGRLVVLPCKVGDIIWFTKLEYCSSDTGFPQKAKIYSVWKDETHNWNFNCASGKKQEFQNFNIDDFGKTVFLTKEAAEPALKGGAE